MNNYWLKGCRLKMVIKCLQKGCAFWRHNKGVEIKTLETGLFMWGKGMQYREKLQEDFKDLREC
jgi:hypothetical protein